MGRLTPRRLRLGVVVSWSRPEAPRSNAQNGCLDVAERPPPGQKLEPRAACSFEFEAANLPKPYAKEA